MSLPSRCTPRLSSSSAAIESGWMFPAAISPRFDVNPNTGEPMNDNRRWQIAENTIFSDADHPSELILPVITN